MRLYLINPSNPLVSIVNVNQSRWNRYRVWKPLSLMVLAGLTPPGWKITIVDENLGAPDYPALPRPDLVGITAFTSQANRAYEVAAYFRSLGVPVLMGGIHATMCLDEVSERVDSVVTGEAESVWAKLLEDARQGRLKPRYEGGRADINDLAPARHDLLPARYAFGAVQTTRGCPLNCNFCSVTTFNGAQYRQRPIPEVVREFRSIREKRILVVDDNLIGTRSEHLARAKDLFRALIQANLRKEWVAQATINFADDDELLALAAQAGCRGVFIGFESPTPEGLRELGKKINLVKGRDFRASVRRIQRHNILVVDDNLIGTRPEHVARAKDLFRALAQANLRKEWVAQATINFADDDELLALAAQAGCRGIFIGFESPTPEGLRELGKKINLVKGRDFRASMRRIQRHNILVVGSFIIGLDVDEPGIGRQIAALASHYGLDNLNTLFLTPLPGTRLWDQMKSEDRIALDTFPEDWRYYTLTFPVAQYKRLSLDDIIQEMMSCNRSFYSLPRILRRVWSCVWQRRQPLISLVGSLSYRSNIRVDGEAYANFRRQRRDSFHSRPKATTTPA